MTRKEKTYEGLQSLLQEISAGLRSYADQLGDQIEISDQLHDLARNAASIERKIQAGTSSPDEELELA